MRRTLIVCVTLSVVIGLAASLLAQQPTGTPHFNSFQSIPGGVINLGTLGAHLNVPIVSKAGSGTPMIANWNYDSEIWYQVNGFWETGLAPNYTPAVGYLGAQVTPGSPAKYVTTGNPWCQATQSYGTDLWNGFYYIDTFGTTHKFPNAALEYPTCGTVSQTTSDRSADGYTLSASVNISTGAITSTVYAPNGTQFNGTSFTGAGTLTDRNGNQIKVASPSSGVYQYTDTLNILALQSTQSGNTITYAYNGECGSLCESVTETTTNYYIASAFSSGCSGAVDYVSSSTTALPTKFALPDGSAYVLTWEQTPLKSSSYTTGRLASITLPTGGKITFTYSGSNNGMNCDGTTSNMSMATPDGTWTYTHSAANGNSIATTTVTDPAGNLTNYNFYMNSSLGALETQRHVYTGSSTLVQTVITCYNGQTPTTSCATAPNSFTSVTNVAQTVIWPNNHMAQFTSNYDSSGRVTEHDETGYGVGAPGGLYRKTLTTYGSYVTSNGSCSALSGNILNAACTVLVEDASGNLQAETAYTRDSHGNVTQLSRTTGQTSNPWIISHATYNTNGTLLTVTDVNGDLYTYNYGDCNGAFLTSITEPASLSKSMTWNCAGGVLTGTTDEAGVSSAINFSGEYFWRPSSVVDGMGQTTSFTYSSPTSFESVQNFSSSTVDILTTLDSLGRVHLRQRRQAPGSGNFDTTTINYNVDGELYTITGPNSQVTYYYDGMGRVEQTNDAGGAQINYNYSSEFLTKVLSPAPTGETTKSWEYDFDSLGRPLYVCEIMPSGTLGSGTCGFNDNQNGFWTSQSFDRLDNLISVTLDSQSGGTPQTRNYTYDQVSRLLSESNPESGSTSYVYDTQSQGDLYQATDAMSNTITYTHGPFHRLTKSSIGTFCRNFLYDSGNAYSGTNATLVNGRLAEAYTTNCGTGGGSASLVQEAASTSCTGSTCNLTVGSTGTGHILTLVGGFGKNVSIASVSGGGSWVCPASAVAANGTSLGSAACYVLSSTAGTTSISINLTGSPGTGIWVAEFREYSATGAPVFDTAGAISDATCTSCAGATLSLSGSNDLVLQMINPANTASAVSSGWGDTDFPGPNYFGVADKLATSSGAAPTWTTTSGIATGSALAFNLGAGSTAYTTEYFGYDADGHTSDLWESTPNSGGLYHVTDQYYPNGAVNTLLAYNSSGVLIGGLPSMTYGVDGEGRPTTVTAGSGTNPVTSATYNSANQLTNLTFGSGDSDTYTYDPNSSRMTQYKFSVNGSNLTGTLTWNSNGTLGKLVIVDPFNSGDAQTCNYTYDGIARLSKADCGTTWGQSFSYDAYGNLSKSVLPGDAGLNWQPGYNNNNRYTLGGVSYDADGHLTADTFHTYGWNGVGDLTSIDGGNVVHDAFGRMVEFSFSGTNYQLLYAPTGAKIALMTGQTLFDARVPLPGGGLASYGTGGLNNFAHADWLGSTRFSSYTSRTMKWDLAHAPYGEVYALSGNGAEFTFTGQFSDTGTSNTLWDFAFREYHSSQGRWISPDPAGLAAVNPMNPQTWNRYAYVGNNPLSSIDPTGLDGDRVPWNLGQPTGGAGGLGPSQAALAGLGPGDCNLTSSCVTFADSLGMQINPSVAMQELHNGSGVLCPQCAGHPNWVVGANDTIYDVEAYQRFGSTYNLNTGTASAPKFLGWLLMFGAVGQVSDDVYPPMAQGVFQGHASLFRQASMTANVLAGATALVPVSPLIASVPGAVTGASVGFAATLETYGIPITAISSWTIEHFDDIMNWHDIFDFAYETCQEKGGC